MSARRGFTMVEIIIALVVLMLVVLGMATATGRFMHVVSESDLQVAAIQLADDRIQEILLDPDYSGLEATYDATESSFPTLDGFTRETTITLVGGAGQSTNHKRILVVVDGPGLSRPIKRSATMAAP